MEETNKVPYGGGSAYPNPIRDFLLNDMRTLETTTKYLLNNVHLKDDIAYFVHKSIKYAKMVSLPLKMNMFIPCDSDNNIISEPKHIDGETPIDRMRRKDVQEYVKAEGRCLFEDFVLTSSDEDPLRASIRHVKTNHTITFNNETGFYDNERWVETVEDLIPLKPKFKKDW